MKLEKEYDYSWRWIADEIVKYAPENYDEKVSIEKMNG